LRLRPNIAGKDAVKIVEHIKHRMEENRAGKHLTMLE